MNILESIKTDMEKYKLDNLILLKPENTFYVSNLLALIYSRPIIAIISREGDSTLIVPQLEEEHATHDSSLDNVIAYGETSDKQIDPFTILNEIIPDISSNTIGVEKGFLPVAVYEKISKSFKNCNFKDVSKLISEKQVVKNKKEIDALLESSNLVSYGVNKSIEFASVGATEIQMDIAGNNAIVEKATKLFPEGVMEHINMTTSGPIRAALPHTFSKSRKFEKGNFVIHSRQVKLNGYHSECERTIILGEPTEKQKDMFETILKAQQDVIEAIKPGVSVAELDKIARDYIKNKGYGQYFIHRTGHGIGLYPHENPSLKDTDPTILKEGMALTVEPGIYINGIGGMRHSDTVLVTVDGNIEMTSAPKDLESLIIK